MSFSQNQCEGSYFAMFSFAAFYCIFSMLNVNEIIPKQTRCFVVLLDHAASHILLQELHSVVAAKGGFLMGALEIDDASKTRSYFGTKDKRELDLVLNTVFTETPRGNDGEFVNQTIFDYQKAVPEFAWPSWIFDGPEYLNRLGKRYTLERLFYLHIVLQLALPGSTVFYYGDEIRLKINATEAMLWKKSAKNGGLLIFVCFKFL